MKFKFYLCLSLKAFSRFGNVWSSCEDSFQVLLHGHRQLFILDHQIQRVDADGTVDCPNSWVDFVKEDLGHKDYDLFHHRSIFFKSFWIDNCVEHVVSSMDSVLEMVDGKAEWVNRAECKQADARAKCIKTTKNSENWYSLVVALKSISFCRFWIRITSFLTFLTPWMKSNVTYM